MRSIWPFIRSLWKRMGEDDVAGLSAQLSYFFLLSLFPFLFFLTTLIGYINISEERIMEFVHTYAPDGAYELIESNVQDILYQQHGGLLSLGIIGTLWAASNGMNAIIKAMDQAYQVRSKRHFLVQRALSVWLLFAFTFIILIALLLSVFGKLIGRGIFFYFSFTTTFLTLWEVIRWGLSSILFFIVLLFLYKWVPHVPLRLKEVWRGALFAVTGWQLVSLAFSIYVNRWGDFSATYGSLGGVIVLMIWFYLSGIILITGGQINALVKERYLVLSKIRR
ncbi:YihY/virulence factor BrkB family protein [Pontibacillus salicampi]|uniref:YihY/virulence factor BrkB family protein n=1 Tax=Pontibacillus salicampi TaxID=1449801 RepID=A0ABV6LPX0_9BACI